MKYLRFYLNTYMTEFNTLVTDNDGVLQYPLTTTSFTIPNETIKFTGKQVHVNGGYLDVGDYYYENDGTNQNGLSGWYIWKHEIYKDGLGSEFLSGSDIIPIRELHFRYEPNRTSAAYNVQLDYETILNYNSDFSNDGIIYYADRETDNVGGINTYTIKYATVHDNNGTAEIKNKQFTFSVSKDDDKIKYYTGDDSSKPLTYDYINFNNQFPDASTDVEMLTTQLPNDKPKDNQFNPYNNINRYVVDEELYKYARLWLCAKQPSSIQPESNPDGDSASNIVETLCSYIDNYGLSSVGKLSLIQDAHYTDKFNLSGIGYDDNGWYIDVELDNSIFYENDKTTSNIRILNKEVLTDYIWPRPFDRSIRVTDKSLGVTNLFPVNFAQGYGNIAAGGGAHAEGKGCKVYDDYAHAEGRNTEARSFASHAEGRDTKAYGYQSHAEGGKTLALNSASHAEGSNTQAIGAHAHSEGYYTKAIGNGAHSEGKYCSAISDYSHAAGGYTVANNDYQFVVGKYNLIDDVSSPSYSTHAFVIGNGTSNTKRSNAFTIDWEGNIETQNKITGECIDIGHRYNDKSVNTNGLSGWYIYYYSIVKGTNNKQVKLWLHDKQPTTFPTKTGSTTSSNLFNTLTTYIEDNSIENVGDVGNLSIIIGTHYTDMFKLISYERVKSSNSSKYYHYMTVELISDINKYDTELKDLTISDIFAGGNACLTASHVRPQDLSIRITDKSLGAVNLFPVTVVEGHGNVAAGAAAHAEGQGTAAYDDFAHAEGSGTLAYGYATHTEGYATSAFGFRSHAEGQETITYSSASHAEGFKAYAYGLNSHAEGANTRSYGDYSHAEGKSSTAFGEYSHAECLNTSAIGNCSHAEGQKTIAYKGNAHAEGALTSAMGATSHAEGYYTIANGDYSHAEGKSSTANGDYSHAEGNGTTANGDYSHAEGNGTTASGTGARASGVTTIASGDYSHAEGKNTQASGPLSHACGDNTVANQRCQFVVGKYNNYGTQFNNALFVVGNGSAATNRSNAFAVNSDGSFTIGNTTITEDHLKKLVDAINNKKI